MRTLGIDCGGSGIKGSVLDANGDLLAERVAVLVLGVRQGEVHGRSLADAPVGRGPAGQ